MEFYPEATLFNFSVLDHRNPKSIMREGGKKTFKKKNNKPIFEKVNEGDQIKKTLDKFLEKVIRVTK